MAGKFKAGEEKLESKGMSKKEAGGIMTKQGIAHLGKKIFEERARAGRMKAAKKC